MYKTEVQEYVKEVANNIKRDSDRLNIILDAINSGSEKPSINIKIVERISKKTIEDDILSSIIEDITLALDNLETQKMHTDKNVIEELIIILKHNLGTLRSIEIGIAKFAAEIDTLKQCAIDSKMVTNNIEPITVNKFSFKESIFNLFNKLAPNSELASTLLWVTILIVIVNIFIIITPGTSNSYIVELIKLLKETK